MSFTESWCLTSPASYDLSNYGFRILRELDFSFMSNYEYMIAFNRLFFWHCPNKGYTDPLPSLRGDHIYKKDEQCAETNEKSIFKFQFLRYRQFQIISINPKNDIFIVTSDAQCSKTNLRVHDFFMQYLFFEIWSILYSTFVIYVQIFNRCRQDEKIDLSSKCLTH